MTAGALLYKWAAKLGSDGAGALYTDRESWDWKAHLKGAAGIAGGAFVANMLKPGSGQKVLDGGLTIMLYNILETEIIPKSDWAERQFGADESEPAVVIGEDEQLYLKQGGNVMPLDDSYRMGLDIPELEGYGDSIVEAGRLGDAIVPAGRLGFGDGRSDALANYSQMYRN